ncbi:MAG: hypothetical protein AB7T49_06930 [Oligoflexales bacterium]
MHFFIVSAFAIFAFGCKTPSEASNVKAETSSVEYVPELPKPECESGETQVSLTLNPLEGPIPQEKPGDIESIHFQAISSGEEESNVVRIDACLNETSQESRLYQVIARPVVASQFEPPLFQRMRPGTDAIINGLDEAVFGDASKILITIPMWGTDAFRIATTEKYTYAVEGKKLEDGKIKTSSSISVGQLVQGDPFSDSGSGCTSGESLKVIRSNIATDVGKVTIETLTCESFTFGTFHHRWQEIRIRDTGLDKENGNKTFSLKVGDGDPSHSYEERTVHHNACTSVVIKLAHATYAYTTKAQPGNLGGGGPLGCGPLVEEAPSIAASPVTSESAFQYQYSGRQKKVIKNPAWEGSDCVAGPDCSLSL